jgi:hypothetical protein
MRSIGKIIALCLLATVASSTFAQHPGLSATQKPGLVAGSAFHGIETRAASR